MSLAVACSTEIPTDDADELSGGTAGSTGGTVAGGISHAGSTATGGKAGTSSNTTAGTAGKSMTGGGGGVPGAGGAGGSTGGSAGTLSGSAGMNGGAGSTGSTGGMGTGGVIGSGGVGSGGVGSGGVGSGGVGSSGVGSSGGAGGVNPGGGRGGIGSGGAGAGGAPTAGASSGGMSGSSSGGTGGDPCAMTTMPSGGTPHTSSNASGTAGGLAWTIWTNSSPGTITTFDVPAFSASWNNSGDYLARIGLQWNASKTYEQYGTITATYNSKKTGSGGGYSYIGMYGWSVSPCVEYYIVDDSYNKMPVNPGNTSNKGTAMIDGGAYTLYTRNTTGTGGSKCSGVTSWVQFYSVRQTARTCGVISLTEHFKAWAAAGMTLGKMDQAQILVEVGGGSGSVEFPVANVTASMP